MAPARAKLAKIHIAKKELQLTDEVYRDLLYLNFGVESAAKLTEKQATDLIELFIQKGWKPKKGTASLGKKQRSGTYIKIQPGPSARQQKKVLAMWNQLGYAMEKLHTRSMTQFGVERFEWLTDPRHLHVLITDLYKRIENMKKGKRG